MSEKKEYTIIYHGTYGVRFHFFIFTDETTEEKHEKMRLWIIENNVTRDKLISFR